MHRKTVVRLAFVAVALGFLAWTIARDGEEIGAALGRLSPWAVAASGAFAILGIGAQMLSWRALFRGAGSEVPSVPVAGRIYYVGQLGKYVPGSVWAVVAQADLGADHKISRGRSTAVALGALTVLLAVGSVVAALALLLGDPDALRAYWWAALAAVAATVVLVPAVFNRLGALAWRVARRTGEAPTVTGRGVLESAAWAFVMWICFGAHALLLVAQLGPGDARSAAVVTGAFALAWVVGLLVVIAPAGAGAREAALVVGLSPVLGAPEALVVAVVSRIVMIAVDALAAAAFVRVRPVAPPLVTAAGGGDQ